jgi:hypothetical protein
MDGNVTCTSLGQVARLALDKLLNPKQLVMPPRVEAQRPILVLLAAGKGTRFGAEPKCIQPVQGAPLAAQAIHAFRCFAPAPVICVVGYRGEEVMCALGPDNLYVRSDNPTGGTAYAAYEAFCAADWLTHNPLLFVAMGDRIAPPAIYRRLWELHTGGDREADLTFLTAHYTPPHNEGKGRIVRNRQGQVVGVVEERDIAAEPDPVMRQQRLAINEGNCPLYLIRARMLQQALQGLTNANAQQQYYLTDMVAAIHRTGGTVRTVTTTPGDAVYPLLTADVTRPADLARLEQILAQVSDWPPLVEAEAGEAARRLAAGRPPGQVAAIARQLAELVCENEQGASNFQSDQPLAIGVAGGRLRIAFMHPDMARFFGPAWQMPIGAGDEQGDEQIVLLAQSAADGRIHLHPLNAHYRERLDFVLADDAAMYPDGEVADLHQYEAFGTRMSEHLLLALGYFSDAELTQRRQQGLPLPPPSLWVSNNLRRPFALVGNALASLRTLQQGDLGARVQAALGKEHFQGLRLLCTGNIPQGGFSSSSAVTVATQNALNALFALEISPDRLVHLACQAEYGTGVRAGSLDQATEQMGQAGQGTLISSNPQEHYRVLATYPMPTERIQVLFPYSVDRDREAWRWSSGVYAASPAPNAPLTTGEMRSLTGKVAELAAWLTHLPLSTSFFQVIQDDLLTNGWLSLTNRQWIAAILRQLPLLVTQAELRGRVAAQVDWYVEQLCAVEQIDRPAARHKADAILTALFTGWREPRLRRSAGGRVVEEHGVPLRAMLAYLFGEVAKNFALIHQPGRWMEWVTRSQRGDRSLEIEPAQLPRRAALESELPWERAATGPARLDRWLAEVGAMPFDYQQGLTDDVLDAAEPPVWHELAGGNFFRGLALVDLAEAMLKRAFGESAVAVRINAAGQGGYFQVHVDRELASPAEVKHFIRRAFYHRFGLTPSPEFVEVHPGGGAVGVRLSRYKLLPSVIRHLQEVLV